MQEIVIVIVKDKNKYLHKNKLASYSVFHNSIAPLDFSGNQGNHN